MFTALWLRSKCFTLSCTIIIETHLVIMYFYPVFQDRNCRFLPLLAMADALIFRLCEFDMRLCLHGKISSRSCFSPGSEGRAHHNHRYGRYGTSSQNGMNNEQEIPEIGWTWWTWWTRSQKHGSQRSQRSQPR